MLIDASTSAALDRIAQRAADVQRAFVPGAVPVNGDVATAHAGSAPAIDPLCVTAPDGAYFLTTDERGRLCYTRDGSFSLNDGALAGGNGRAMLGYTSAHGAPEALRVDAIDGALGRANGARVDADGTLAYDRDVIDPRSGERRAERVVVGHLALARFPAATNLVAVDANHVAAPPGTTPHVGRPGDGNFGRLTPFARERSRVDLDESLRRLKDAYLAFDALQAAHKAQGHLGKTAMDLLK